MTGVQKCALPICPPTYARVIRDMGGHQMGSNGWAFGSERTENGHEIGRASWRERVEISVVAGALKKKKDKKRSGDRKRTQKLEM